MFFAGSPIISGFRGTYGAHSNLEASRKGLSWKQSSVGSWPAMKIGQYCKYPWRLLVAYYVRLRDAGKAKHFRSLPLGVI